MPEPHWIEGGQGRGPQDVEESAWSVVWVFLACVVVGAIAYLAR